jgi:hypothetical protein
MQKSKKISHRKVVLAICTVIIGGLFFSILTKLLSSSLEGVFKTYLGENYNLVLGGLLFFTIIVMIFVSLMGGDEPKQKIASSTQDLRSQFLPNLQQLYEKRLHDKMQGELNFEIKLNLTYTTEGHNPQTVEDFFIINQESSAGDFNRLFENYTKKLWRLLILGEPGAGKSILLLRFGLRLVELAEQNPDFPIPVLLDLASWKDEAQTFEVWLEKNLPYLGGSFAVSKENAKQLVENKAILPLLDGFDEIKEQYRNSCLRQLSLYLLKIKNSRTKPLPEVIICSRIIEYGLADDAPVFAALKIQPLTPKDIDASLQPLADKNFVAAKRLQKTLKESPNLYPAITSAFFVHTLLDISQKSPAIFTGSSIDELHQEIIEYYIRLEIDKITAFPNDKSKKWLGWLASKLKYHAGKTTFELTDLQPDWPKNKNFCSFIYGIYWFLNSLLFSLVTGLTIYSFSRSFLLMSLTSSFLLGIIAGFTFDDIESQEIQHINFTNISWKKFKIALLSILPVGLILVPVLTIPFFILDCIRSDQAEAMVRNLSTGLLKVPVGFLVSAFGQGWILYLILNTVLAVLIIVSLMFISVLVDQFIEVESFPKISSPYRRLFAQFGQDCIRYSLQLSVVLGFLIIFLMKTYRGFFLGILVGLFFAVLTSPFSGHFCVRLSLYLEKVIPLKLVNFLDHVSARTGLIIKDGGKWRFRHQLILDHLAEWFEVNHSLSSN